jgi:predicted naringenin-chalcone synthase
MNEEKQTEIKVKKMEYLAEVLRRCLKEPALTPEDIGMVIGFEMGDGLSKFLKGYKKEIKSG